MTFKLDVEIPELEFDPDMEALEDAILEAARESMRVKGGERGENLSNLNEAGAAGAAEELDRQAKTRGIIKKA